MANVINVEKAQYINDNIEIYASNKLSQYSKFLDKNPLFITYFKINENHSRHDVGTGGIHSDLGKTSPIRFNQINNFPVYNIPELKPTVEYDDNGYDVNLEINDIVVLPNTLKPHPGDYVLIQIPGSPDFLFRVNEFSYNTIQSNDYYTFTADLKHVGENLISRIKPQVVEVYETIFENIGTSDKCFIRSEDVGLMNNVASLLNELADSYYHNFFDKLTGNFVCTNNDITKDHSWFYDKFIEYFIMESQLYYASNEEHTTISVCADLDDRDFMRMFRQTLQYAVLHQTTDYLYETPYYFLMDVHKPLSPFVIYHIKCKSTNLVITPEEFVDRNAPSIRYGTLREYYPHLLIQACKKEIDENDVEDNTGEEEIIEEDYTGNSYLETIIYQYLTGNTVDIERKKVIPFTLRVDPYTYMMMPLVIYIVKQYYNSYFKSSED